MQRSAIIIGASTGIGAAVANRLSAKGWTLGLMARSTDTLHALAEALPGPCYVQTIDLRNHETALSGLQQLWTAMGGVHLVWGNAGINHLFPSPDQTDEVIRVNVLGLVGCLEWAREQMLAQGHGHIAATTSIASIRGSGPSPVYGGTKAFLVNYLEGLAKQAYKRQQPLTVTDIRPGYIATSMTQGQKGLFWLEDLDKAADQIVHALEKQKRVAYIMPRWRLIALLMRFFPWWMYRKV